MMKKIATTKLRYVIRTRLFDCKEHWWIVTVSRVIVYADQETAYVYNDGI